MCEIESRFFIEIRGIGPSDFRTNDDVPEKQDEAVALASERAKDHCPAKQSLDPLLPGSLPRRVALALFAGQMVLNVAWTPAFFAAENLLAGLVVIVALWPAVVATVVGFDRVDRRAALLLVPYLAWVTFAAVLNYQFWRLN